MAAEKETIGERFDILHHFTTLFGYTTITHRGGLSHVRSSEEEDNPLEKVVAEESNHDDNEERNNLVCGGWRP